MAILVFHIIWYPFHLIIISFTKSLFQISIMVYTSLHWQKNWEKFGNVFVYRVNLTNFWKIFPKFDITKLKNKTMVTYSNQGLQSLVHIFSIQLKWCSQFENYEFEYFSNQNKYIFCKNKQKFMLNFMDLSFQDC
jgi:hypothetical protein